MLTDCLIYGLLVLGMVTVLNATTFKLKIASFPRIWAITILTYLVFALPDSKAFAQDTSYRNVQLPYNITLDIPTHWTVLTMDTRHNIAAAAEGMLDKAGVEGVNGRKERLLAVTSKPPGDIGATIRISVTSPTPFSQADLAATTANDLKAVDDETLALFQQILASGGAKLIEMQPAHIESFNNHLALVYSYIRAGVDGPSPWKVTQYKIPVSNRLLEVTLSHSTSEGFLWDMILERVKRSVRF